ncbi:MAG: T9SS type A sorting domain-containing protein [Bacteroidia bacterium]
MKYLFHRLETINCQLPAVSLIIFLLYFSTGVRAQDWDGIIKAVASDRATNDFFGWSVAISGDYAIVGAFNEDEDASGGATLSAAGSAYIFKHTGGVWTEQQKIVASDRGVSDNFGRSVSMSGDYAIVGAHLEDEDASGGATIGQTGSAYIFKRTGAVWTETQKIVASDRATNDYFGYSVAISGDYAIVGAYRESQDASGGATLSTAGSAYIFKQTGGIWAQQQKIVAADRAASDQFSINVAISGDYAIVGANFEDEDVSGGATLSAAGSAYIFKQSAGVWAQQQKIVAADRGVSDNFGIQVAISGDYAIVGADQEDEDTFGGATLSAAGSAYIYKQTGGVWAQQQKIVATDRGAGDNFGFSVGIDGNYAIVGAWAEDHNASGGAAMADAGSAYIFRQTGEVWAQQQKIVAPDRGAGDRFSYNGIAINGYHVIVGAYAEDHDVSGGATLSAAGSVYFFCSNVWTGNINTDWSTAGNWCGTVPISTTNVIIPPLADIASGNLPHVNSGSAVANDLLIFGSSSVTIGDVNSGSTLTLSGNLNNNGTVSIEATSSQLVMVGDLNNSGTINIESSSELEVAGDITNTGTASFGVGTVRLTGPLEQTIGGTTTSQFGNLYVANAVTGTALTLNQDLTVSTNLNMLNINGKLDLNTHTIDLGTTGTLSNESNSNRIFCSTGTGVITATRTLSANSNLYSNIAGLGVSITTGAGNVPGETDITRGYASQQTATPAATAPNNSLMRYFDIDAETNTALDATLKISYFNDELSANGSSPVEDQLIPWRSEDAGTTWEGQHFPSRLSNSSAADWVQLTQIPAFSRWTLSDWLTEPLPVELLNFSATANMDLGQVDLSWVTASETNCHFFTVERSANAQTFEPIFNRDGAGNSNTIRTYAGIDPNSLSGISYYRLLQTDFDGQFSYSQIVPVSFDGAEVQAINSWVNQDRNIQIQVTGRKRENLSMQIFDETGRLVLSEQLSIGKGMNSHLLYNPGLASGIYLLRIDGGRKMYTQKLVIR